MRHNSALSVRADRSASIPTSGTSALKDRPVTAESLLPGTRRGSDRVAFRIHWRVAVRAGQGGSTIRTGRSAPSLGCRSVRTGGSAVIRTRG